MHVISTDRTTALSLTTASDEVFILPGVKFAAFSDWAAIYGDAISLEITNFGNVFGFNYGMQFYVSASGGNIANSAGAIIAGGSTGLSLESAFTYISNGGTISGGSGAAVEMFGNWQSLHNLAGGTLRGGLDGVLATGECEIFNDGTISARGVGVRINGFSEISNAGSIFGSGEYGVVIQGSWSSLTNSGYIGGSHVGVYVVADTGETRIYNSGTIEGIYIESSSTSPTFIFNSGELHGVYNMYSGPVVLRNSGDIIGDVVGGYDTQDTIRNIGTIAGEVRLQGGNDIFNGAGGTVTGSVDGGAGNDRLTAGDHDVVRGGLGNDLLRGAGTMDTLIGGRNADRMFGGGGADTFLFESHLESGATNGTADRILLFDRNQDIIDLELVDADSVAAGNQEFTFIGTASFSNVAGQLRAVNAGANVFLQADLDGNGTTDFQVILGGLSGQAAQFTAEDFVL
ncbi:MAG TPA: hypothetical protein VF589_12600 [Allosphingosinicella sp.]|jgi:Ca2+-binding RTX toxin-like protein